ncbi:18428_t:CDS:2, partial [Gigaspora rosea]
EAWLSNEDFNNVKKLVSNLKKMFLYSKNRRNRYIIYLKQHGIKEYNQLESDSTQNQQITLKLMPLPVSTRWNSWFKTAIYVCNYLEYIREIYLTFTKIYAPFFISILNYFQSECQPIFPFIEQRIHHLEIFLKSGTTNLQFGEEINA